MRAAGYIITENAPYEQKASNIFSDREVSPYVNRIRMRWAEMRGAVPENFPRPLCLEKYVERSRG
jgi:hypothetical protein